jgi:hypothetical protein
MEQKIRQPQVAGQFYPDDPQMLKSQIKGYLSLCKEPERVTAILAPHAGYIYSGHVAGAVYGRIYIPKIVIILCPKHTPFGSEEAIMTEGLWKIPGAEIPVNQDIGKEIQAEAKLKEDIYAHRKEHSLEVQLPFLYYLNNNIEIVPIALGRISDTRCKEIGESIAKIIKDKEILLVASTDMSHYVSQKQAEEMDYLAIEKILKVDGLGLLQTVRDYDISMCGVIPSAVTLFASAALKKNKGELIKYATSGDVSGDYDQVVGYVGILIR